jgi:hypothetical protein
MRSDVLRLSISNESKVPRVFKNVLITSNVFEMPISNEDQVQGLIF